MKKMFNKMSNTVKTMTCPICSMSPLIDTVCPAFTCLPNWMNTWDRCPYVTSY